MHSDRRVVHIEIDRTQPFNHFIDHARHIAFDADISQHMHGPDAACLDLAQHIVFRSIAADGDVNAFICQRHYNSAPDTGSTAGNQRVLAT